MSIPLIFFFFLILIILGIWLAPTLIYFRRQKVKNRAFSSQWITILQNNLPIYKNLSPSRQRKLRGYMQVFLAEKQFIGCQGLNITDEIKLTIAANACLLLFNGRESYFSQLDSILVYPNVYKVTTTEAINDYIVREKQDIRLGESWGKGRQIVLSWKNIEQDILHWHDGRNVILHEFAHQLDQENGRSKGVPILDNKVDYNKWQEIFNEEYKRLKTQVMRGKKTVIDAYGATHPAEFFAVVTETFFEKPHQLQKKHSQLYNILKDYYCFDPAQFINS